VRGSSHGSTGPARRLVGVALIACAAAAAGLAIGSALAARPTAAKPPPLAALDRTYRALLPAARCPAGSAKLARATRLRAAALKGAATAPPKALRRKRASMRRAIRLLRQAGDLCEAPPGTGGATPPPAGTPPPGPGPDPPAPGTQVVALGTVSSGIGFSPATSVTVSAGTIRFQLTNTGSLTHGIGVRTPPPPLAPLGAATPVSPGNSTSVDVTLGAGDYQIYCNYLTHAASGMVVPLTVTP
jgi:plastocyanin